MIVWLASYPRSGNTFMRVLLKACFGLESYSQYNDAQDIGGEDTFQAVVGHKAYSGPWEEYYGQAKKSNNQVLIKTHHAPLDTAKTIYLVRDPRSVVVSFHNYLQNFSPLKLQRRDTIMGATAFGSWGQHVTSWRPEKREDTLLVHFEELIKNPQLIAEKVGRFLELDQIGSDIPGFDELKSINSKFFNTGSNKKNVASLSSEELNLINFLFKEPMKQMGYEPMERVHRGQALNSIMSVSKNVWALQHDVKRHLDENAKRLGSQKLELARQHTKELELVRGEQQEFVNQLINSIRSSGLQAEALAKQSIALTEKFEKTNEQLQNLWSQKSELTSTVKLLRNQRQSLTDERDRLQQDNSKLITGMQKMEASSQNQQEDLKGKIAKLEAGESAYARVLEKMQNLRAALASQEDLKSQIAAVQKQVQKLESEKAQLKQDLAQFSSAKQKLTSKIAYRDRVIESSRTSIAEAKGSLSAQTLQIESLTAQLNAERDRVDKFQTFITEATSQKLEREKFIREMESELHSIQEKALNLSKRNQELNEKYNLTINHYDELNQAVAPRMKSVLTLKPIRFVLNRRELVKRGDLVLDEHGRPILDNIEFTPPPDLVRPMRRGKMRDSKSTPTEKAPSIYKTYQSKKPLGIAVYTFDRTESVESVLESLLLQEGLDNTHVWIDGDQGNPKKRQRLDRTEKCVASFPVKQIHRNRGNYGFRKMMIVSMRKMFEIYERVLFLEDDCFPTRHALKGFSSELDQIEDDASIFSVYGHPFLTANEEAGPIGRFQGWGWASTRAKIMPLWSSLLDMYLMSEDEYKAYIDAELNEDILQHIDVTPGRQPSSTLPKFFAWDEVLGFLAGRNKMTHKRTAERLIYNFGVGDSSTHFNNVDHFRKPPFNMVSADEIWQYF